VLPNIGYTVVYSDSRMNPLWVSYCVLAVSQPVAHPRPGFRVDKRTAARVSDDDYTGSGYDRGHMAPNAAIDYCYGEAAQRETFYMSNVSPQTATLNRGIWETLEEKEREWANAFEEVRVFTGPIFKGSTERLASGVEIPDEFYKIIVRGGNTSPYVLTFVIPQSVQGGGDLVAYLTSVDSVELRTRLDFFSALADSVETTIEAQVATVLWSTSSSGSNLPPTTSPPPPTAAPCSCGGPDLNCGDFATHAAAQACYDYCKQQGHGDVFRLDGDSDGSACESLP
jgi:endonuclease G